MVAIASPQNQSADREGRRIAQLFRKYRELGDVRACDLGAILNEDDIELHDSDCLNPGYTACLVRNPYDGPGGGIFLEAGQGSGRRRFSIAHELGHYHIPTHRKEKVEGYCADRDLRARDKDARQVEWQANDFAAELLMPMRLYAADVARRAVSFETVYSLAGPSMYDVSVTAAAWRLVQASKERCALVVTTKGRVEWIVRSDSFRLRLTERQQHLHAHTAAASFDQTKDGNERPQEVPTYAWIESDVPQVGELLESTHGIIRLGQVLSLLWYIEPDADDEE